MSLKRKKVEIRIGLVQIHCANSRCTLPGQCIALEAWIDRQVWYGVAARSTLNRNSRRLRLDARSGDHHARHFDEPRDHLRLQFTNVGGIGARVDDDLNVLHLLVVGSRCGDFVGDLTCGLFEDLQMLGGLTLELVGESLIVAG